MRLPTKNGPATLATMRQRRSQYRTARMKRLQLERELAAYSTPSDRLELDAILSRYTEEETREINDILTRQRMHRR